MSRKLAVAALLVISAAAFTGADVKAEVPDQLLGTWLPLDGFGRLTKPDERPTCIGGDRAIGTYVLLSNGEWDERGGGTATACAFQNFEKVTAKNRWTSVGACGHDFATEVRVDWTLTRDGSRLTEAAKYDRGDTLVLHYRRCMLKEKIAGIGLPVSEFKPDGLARRAFALSYAGAASKLCPQFVYDEDRAAAVAKETEGFAPEQITAARVGADKRPIPEIVREGLHSPLTNLASFGPAEDDDQIGNRELYCTELLKRFGKDGTLIRGLLKETAAPP